MPAVATDAVDAKQAGANCFTLLAPRGVMPTHTKRCWLVCWHALALPTNRQSLGMLQAIAPATLSEAIVCLGTTGRGEVKSL
jgi:hypothetical protein